MILVVNICKEKLHYFEFVKPVEDILRKNGFKFFVRNYNEIKKGDLMNAKKVIICGTSLKDNEFLEKDFLLFDYLKNGTFEGAVLGICGGMQIIGKLFWLKNLENIGKVGSSWRDILKSKLEIGFFQETFLKDFLGLQGEVEVYHLHKNYVDFSKLKDFEIYCGWEVSQAVKHKEKPIYGVLFHPEVRNKSVILEFAKNG